MGWRNIPVHYPIRSRVRVLYSDTFRFAVHDQVGVNTPSSRCEYRFRVWFSNRLVLVLTPWGPAILVFGPFLCFTQHKPITQTVFWPTSTCVNQSCQDSKRCLVLYIIRPITSSLSLCQKFVFQSFSLGVFLIEPPLPPFKYVEYWLHCCNSCRVPLIEQNVILWRLFLIFFGQITRLLLPWCFGVILSFFANLGHFCGRGAILWCGNPLLSPIIFT